MLLAKVYITLRPGVLDPQGEVLGRGLQAMGYKNVDSVKVGKCLEIKLNTADEEAAASEVEEMCRRLLANSVIEQYEYSLKKMT